ncbi:Sensor protein ZraS [Rubripirellula tenax]|uniref:histidine kinase n=1 Tax=Rubripirellula tenax TaxID=2528015 RepID=A0A5C6FKW3_9BACT|nr:ATP-binding protein [Rubripirellula tenax]TWU60252.1 Sensor protein ZraS [Rubripirellula tenax]
MRILLIEPDSQLHERWRSRLLGSPSELTIVCSDAEAIHANESSHFTVVLHACNESGHASGHASEPFPSESLLGQLRLRAGYAICVTSVEAVRQIAFAAGYDDCIAHECSDAELATQLRHARDLQNLNQRLAQAQKLESIGELAAGIAHEINTPIQYVGDNTRFVQEACNDLQLVLESCQSLLVAVDSGANVDEATQNLRVAIEEADIDYLIEEIPSAITQTLEGVDRVANIVRAMKEFAHPGVSEMTLTDLAQSIENTAMVARNEWKYVADLETIFDPDMPPIHCLPGELNQVLLNMIVNAAHAIGDTLSETPDAKGKITISTHLKPQNAEIRISDTGSGISAENVERIFTPFFTTKRAGKGTGQGLAIAHSVIVEKHGGSIGVESEVGKGTTFVIQIPRERQRVSDIASQPQKTEPTAQAAGVAG